MSSSSITMKAFAISEYKPIGELDHLVEVQVPKPSAPRGHDVLVKIKAVATNPIDYKRLGNLGNHTASYEVDGPLIVGWDGAGIIEAVGDRVTLFQRGDEVMFAGDFFRAGCFAEYTLVDERVVAKKPTSVSWSQAASLPLVTLTAWESFADQLKISEKDAGKTILITAGAGGVGSAAITIAKKVLNLTVIASASRAETTKYAKARGADFVVSHHESYQGQLKKLGFDSVDYVLHCSHLTPELFTEFTEIVKPFGGIASIWPSATVDLMQLFWKSINFSAELMFTRPKTGVSIERQHEILTKVGQLVDNGDFKVAETRTWKLNAENLREVLTIQASGKAIGKMTLSFAA
jgi:NADPH:quinone reductase